MAKWLAGLLLGVVGLLSVFFSGRKSKEVEIINKEKEDILVNQEKKEEIHEQVQNADIAALVKLNNDELGDKE